jgi:hypothetical protein
LSNLYDSLDALGKYFEDRPSVTWTLMQTSDEGRRGYVVFVADHDPPFVNDEREIPAILCNLNSTDLAALGDEIQQWLQTQRRKGN